MIEYLGKNQLSRHKTNHIELIKTKALCVNPLFHYKRVIVYQD